MGTESKKERLNIAFKYLYDNGIVHSVTDLAKKMGRARPGVSNAVNGNETYLSDSFLADFAECFGDVFHEDWVKDGKGPMLVEQVQAPAQTGNNTKVSYNDDTFLRQLLDARDESNRDLRALNERLQSMIEDRDATISEQADELLQAHEQLTELDARVEHYKQLVTIRENEAEQLKVQIDDIRIGQVEKDIYTEKLNNIVDGQQKTIADRDRTISALQAHIDHLMAELKRLRGTSLYDTPPMGVAEELRK